MARNIRELAAELIAPNGKIVESRRSTSSPKEHCRTAIQTTRPRRQGRRQADARLRRDYPACHATTGARAPHVSTRTRRRAAARLACAQIPKAGAGFSGKIMRKQPAGIPAHGASGATFAFYFCQERRSPKLKQKSSNRGRHERLSAIMAALPTTARTTTHAHRAGSDALRRCRSRDGGRQAANRAAAAISPWAARLHGRRDSAAPSRPFRPGASMARTLAPAWTAGIDVTPHQRNAERGRLAFGDYDLFALMVRCSTTDVARAPCRSVLVSGPASSFIDFRKVDQFDVGATRPEIDGRV